MSKVIILVLCLLAMELNGYLQERETKRIFDSVNEN